MLIVFIKKIIKSCEKNSIINNNNTLLINKLFLLNFNKILLKYLFLKENLHYYDIML